MKRKRNDLKYQAIELSKKIGGKIEIRSKEKLNSKNISILYTPGVASVSNAIHKDSKLSYKYTIRKNSVAVISDGSAVLGLGNIGSEAALPVMEGKALLFRELAGIDAFPIVLKNQDPEEIINVVKALEPTFGAINLEDIAAPKCFDIEKRLKKELGIPVMHDDQHGTAVVVLAGLINALKVVNKKISEVKIVISGAGAAGIAITKILLKFGARNIIVCDSQGTIYQKRKGLNETKKEIAKQTNPENEKSSLKETVTGADVFIGVSAPKILAAKDVSRMNKEAIVFSLANPVPEIDPREAQVGGAKIIATGRSDFPNQLNNVLAFPGIFRGALDNKVSQITEEHKIKAAEALAGLIKNPTAGKIIPRALDRRVVKSIARTIK